MKNMHIHSGALRHHGINYTVQGNYLVAGKIDEKNSYTLHLSIKTIHTVALIDRMIEIVSALKTPFRLINNPILQYQLNAGMFGDSEIGKVLSLYPQTAAEALRLANHINLFCSQLKGPVITGTTRIGQIIYAENLGLTPLIYKIEKEFTVKNKKAVLLGKCYVPIAILKQSSKGNIYLAISLKHASFKKCVLKTGNPAALDDVYEREMKDRLGWQKTVLQDLARQVMTPAYLDYFEIAGHSYLVLQYADGEILFKVVKQQFEDKTWNGLAKAVQRKLLLIYLQAVAIVKTIHQKGYVHRDISDSNFILLKDGKLCIIDFELSYAVTRNEPKHPFLLGTYGYMAPEQLQNAKPDYQEDIYSLGALLCFMLTSIPPKEFMCTDSKKLAVTLQSLTADTALNQMILSCLSANRLQRPAIAVIEDQVLRYINHLNIIR